ncbi:MAG: hypothetical protein BMS9Abin22_077 [Gammaproteobacteria bacterium]|nr:MAG: hypothetical protein BMS9Abin22_077 [Gammaproteobacteria bacterium]
MQKKQILGIVIALLTVGFLAMLPGIAEEAYKQGLVEAYERELTASGLTMEQSLSSETHHLRLETAKRAGIIYAALFISGFHLPLLGIVILLLLYTFSVGSTKIILFTTLATILVGITLIMLSQIQYGKNPEAAFYSSIGIWMFVAILFGVIIALIWTTKRFLRKKSA